MEATAQFLSGIWAGSGSWVSIGWMAPGRSGMRIRSWRNTEDGRREAAVFALDMASRHGATVYHALTTFHTAAEKAPGVWEAPRLGSNAELLKTLIIDCDIKREGDGKTEAQAFASQREAVRWVLKFVRAVNLPRPNRAVSSGYGIHFYWVFEDPIPPAQWHPLADALSNAMLANGWTQDTKSTKDVVRVLRPPGTANYKAGQDKPVPVMAIDKFTGADIANQVIEAALTPFLGQRATGTHGTGATILSLGARPSHMPPGDKGAGLNQAAHEGLQQREFLFANIAKNCAQAKLSLETNGRDDTYPVWYLGNLTLLTFCQDGDQYAHEVSNAYPRYDHANTEAHYQRAKADAARKGLGAPRCSSYNSYRPGVCEHCPFWEKITSPISTGAVDGDLPPGYRRGKHKGWPQLEYLGKDDEWMKLLEGDVYLPTVNRLPSGGFVLMFAYELGEIVESVAFRQVDAADGVVTFRALERQGLALPLKLQREVVVFLMAWITQIRKLQHVRHDIVLRPFGWNFDADSKLLGISIAGDHYRCDEGFDRVPGGDAKLNAAYTPVGTFENWRQAAALFEGGRADLQAIIACAFASPLFQLAGNIHGMSFNFWSIESGIGKTSALMVGQTVWGNPSAISNLNDTPNAVMKHLSEPRILTRFWDELRLPTLDRVIAFVDMIYCVPGGRERARLHSDTSLRETGEWDCAVVFTSNRSQLDHLLANNEGTDSGVQRLFEVQMAKQEHAFDASAGQRMKLLDTNYGHAGRRYAAWIAANAPRVEALLSQISERLNTVLKFKREERFYNVALTTVICGAMIARKIGLFNFDIDGIRDCLVGGLVEMRKQLEGRVMVADQGGYRVEDLVTQFMADMADYRVRTDKLGGPGVRKVAIWARPTRNEIRYQIAEDEEPNPIMRTSRAAFFGWLGRKGYSSQAVLEQLRNNYGAHIGRWTIGGGTEYATGQLWAIDLPMLGELAAAVEKLRDIREGSGTNDGA